MDLKSRLSGLDGLRGIAALSVLLFHLWLYARVDPPAGAASGLPDWAWSSMRWGLILFFVLSGFLLYRPWLASGRDGTRPDLWRYARSRAARVLPAYYLALAGSVLLLWESGTVPGVRLPGAESLPLFVFFAQNFSSGSLLTLDPPMWTLAVEVSFYVVLPLLGIASLRIGHRRRTWLPIGLLAAGMAWSWIVSANGGPLVLTKVLPAMLPFFAAGMLAATLLQDREPDARCRRLLGFGALAGVVVQLGVERLLPSLVSLLHDLPIALSCAALIVLASSQQAPKLLRSRALIGLGTVSYGLYLWHVPVIWWLRSRGLLPLDPVAALPVVLAPSLVLATLSWFCIERPAIVWARHRREVRLVRRPAFVWRWSVCPGGHRRPAPAGPSLAPVKAVRPS